MPEAIFSFAADLENVVFAFLLVSKDNYQDIHIFGKKWPRLFSGKFSKQS
jgi:hypothetical protein